MASVAMDSRRRTKLFGVVVTSMAEWPNKVEASIFALKTDMWKMAATTHECVEPVCTLDPVCGSAGASGF